MTAVRSLLSVFCSAISFFKARSNTNTQHGTTRKTRNTPRPRGAIASRLSVISGMIHTTAELRAGAVCYLPFALRRNSAAICHV